MSRPLFDALFAGSNYYLEWIHENQRTNFCMNQNLALRMEMLVQVYVYRTICYTKDSNRAKTRWRSFVCSFVRSFVRPSVRPPVRPSVRPCGSSDFSVELRQAPESRGIGGTFPWSRHRRPPELDAGVRGQTVDWRVFP